MANTPTMMTIKTASRVLQRALQLLLAVIALLIALMAQSSDAHALSEPHAPTEVIRLRNEAPPSRRAPSQAASAATRVRETARRPFHARPDRGRWHNLFFEFEIKVQRSDVDPANVQGVLQGRAAAVPFFRQDGYGTKAADA